MSTDKLFILLLVVLLPLSGCLDTVEPAGADAAHSDADSHESPDVLTLHIQPNDSRTILLNGTTLKLETFYQLYTDPDCSSNCAENWIVLSNAAMGISLDCDDGTNLTTWVYSTHYLPIIGGTECEIIFNPDHTAKESIMVFSAHSAAAL